MKQPYGRTRTICLWLGGLIVAFFSGQFHAHYTSWQPLHAERWERKLISRHGVVTLSIDDSGPKRLWTIRVPCSLTGTREQVIDHLVGTDSAGLLACNGTNHEIVPDPIWQDWFSDAPAALRAVPEGTKKPPDHETDIHRLPYHGPSLAPTRSYTIGSV